MCAGHVQEKRRLASCDEADAMVQNNLLQTELGLRRLGDHLHLVLRHWLVRFVFNAGNLASTFQRADGSPKVNRCASRSAEVIRV